MARKKLIWRWGNTSIWLCCWRFSRPLTVFIISASYSQIIELFPTGGGGYLVATKLLGSRAGLVSGSALVVDYMLTITISIASSADALFSFLPAALSGFKFAVEVLLIFA